MSYNENLDKLIVYYLEEKNITDYVGKYTLTNNGDNSDTVISSWNVPNVTQPTKEQLLAQDINDVDAKKSRRDKLNNIKNTKLEKLNANQITALTSKFPDGCLFLNTTTNKLNYTNNGAVFVL